MKIITLLLALFNSMVAGLILAVSLSAGELRQAAPLWLAVKLISALLVIAVGMLTWLSAIRRISFGLVLLSGLMLVMLGTATALWTVHLAQVTGDMEFYMIIFGASLIVQGIASLWDLQHDPKLMPSH